MICKKLCVNEGEMIVSDSSPKLQAMDIAAIRDAISKVENSFFDETEKIDQVPKDTNETIAGATVDNMDALLDNMGSEELRHAIEEAESTGNYAALENNVGVLREARRIVRFADSISQFSVVGDTLKRLDSLIALSPSRNVIAGSSGFMGDIAGYTSQISKKIGPRLRQGFEVRYTTEVNGTRFVIATKKEGFQKDQKSDYQVFVRDGKGAWVKAEVSVVPYRDSLSPVNRIECDTGELKYRIAINERGTPKLTQGDMIPVEAHNAIWIIKGPTLTGIEEFESVVYQGDLAKEQAEAWGVRKPIDFEASSNPFTQFEVKETRVFPQVAWGQALGSYQDSLKARGFVDYSQNVDRREAIMMEFKVGLESYSKGGKFETAEAMLAYMEKPGMRHEILGEFSKMGMDPELAEGLWDMAKRELKDPLVEGQESRGRERTEEEKAKSRERRRAYQKRYLFGK